MRSSLAAYKKYLARDFSEPHKITGGTKETLSRADMYDDNRDDIINDIHTIKEICLDETVNEKEREAIKKLAKRIITHYDDCTAYKLTLNAEINMEKKMNEASKEIFRELEGKASAN